MRRKVVSIRPALIHANGIRAGLVATVATLGLGTRVIWHLHDLLPRHPLSTAIRAFACFSRHTRMIAVSQAVADNFRGARPLLRKRVSVILNAIDLDRFQPSVNVRAAKRHELELDETEMVIGIVGQITPRKGQLELMRAFARVLIELPHAVLLIVGAPLFNRDHQYLEVLKRTALDNGLGPSVRMLGARSDVAAIMQSLDLLVVNSSAEPFGLVALEAMACGTPVLAAATGGLSEIIEHGKDGWLILPGDEKTLAAQIVSLSRQPMLRTRLANEGKKKVALSFSSYRYLSELQDFYLESLKSEVVVEATLPKKSPRGISWVAFSSPHGGGLNVARPFKAGTTASATKPRRVSDG